MYFSFAAWAYATLLQLDAAMLFSPISFFSASRQVSQTGGALTATAVSCDGTIVSATILINCRHTVLGRARKEGKTVWSD